ncbi:hypothetical protein SESBI_47043 [Sesbania bispinosa]|nr:hypothetical protein SESBI_47043 [Sesbania bispinosa]
MTTYNGFQDLSKRKRHNVKRRKSELQQHANQGATEQKTCVRDMTSFNGFQDLNKRKRHNVKRRKVSCSSTLTKAQQSRKRVPEI